MRQYIKKIIGKRLTKQVSNFLQKVNLKKLEKELEKNYNTDFRLYKKNSSVFSRDNFGKKESEITLRYHSIEKGFLHNPIRYRFAKQRVEELLFMMKDDEIIKNKDRVQIQSAIASLCNYYETHAENNKDISDFFPISEYEFLKAQIITPLDSIKRHTYESFFSKRDDNFSDFSNSRCSVRSFTGEKIPIKTIENVINLANNVPSVCNRQSVSVLLIENKKIIDDILHVQGGLTGYSEKINQLLVVVSNRNYFYSIGERNQLYIDGGLYLMNLLYALHYYKIGACPAHWGMQVEADEIMRKLLNISDELQIISLVVIGIPTDSFTTTLSLRKTFQENLTVIN